MNLLGLVFSLLLLISYGYYAIWDKHVAGNKLRTSYTAHHSAQREMLNEFESAFYNGLSSVQTQESTKEPSQQTKNKEKECIFTWICCLCAQ